jgi:hypothetical protein
MSMGSTRGTTPTIWCWRLADRGRYGHGNDILRGQRSPPPGSSSRAPRPSPRARHPHTARAAPLPFHSLHEYAPSAVDLAAAKRIVGLCGPARVRERTLPHRHLSLYPPAHTWGRGHGRGPQHAPMHHRDPRRGTIRTCGVLPCPLRRGTVHRDKVNRPAPCYDGEWKVASSPAYVLPTRPLQRLGGADPAEPEPPPGPGRESRSGVSVCQPARWKNVLRCFSGRHRLR